MERFEGTKPFNLTLTIVPHAEREKFNALSCKHTYHEIRPNCHPGMRGAYRVEMTYDEYCRARQDASDPDINLVAVEPVLWGSLPAVPNATTLSYLDETNADALGATGEGIIVGQIDTGISSTLQSTVFAGRIHARRAFGSGRDANDDIGDGSPHGSHMSGLGTPAASRVAIAAAENNDTAYAEAVYWQADTVGCHLMFLEIQLPSPTTVLGDAVAHAISRGIVVLGAAGNGGAENAGGPGEEIALYPAAYPSVLAISNYDPATDEIAQSSNYGSHLFAATNGMGIRRYEPDGSESNDSDGGTSSALANAAGLVARLLSSGVVSGSGVAGLLADTARKTGADSIYEGNGVLQLEAALGFELPDVPYLPRQIKLRGIVVEGHPACDLQFCYSVNETGPWTALVSCDLAGGGAFSSGWVPFNENAAADVYLGLFLNARSSISRLHMGPIEVLMRWSPRGPLIPDEFLP